MCEVETEVDEPGVKSAILVTYAPCKTVQSCLLLAVKTRFLAYFHMLTTQLRMLNLFYQRC